MWGCLISAEMKIAMATPTPPMISVTTAMLLSREASRMPNTLISITTIARTAAHRIWAFTVSLIPNSDMKYGVTP